MIAGEQLENTAAFEHILAAERARLLRWCLRLVGDRETAEDIVQETLSAAWRGTRRPALEQEYPAWLAGIARNICRSWRRSHQRDQARQVPLLVVEAEANQGDTPSADLADTLDLETLLERKELIELLERALALLPSETRSLLLAKYIEEFPISEIAARLRISEGAAASRLARGKVALRHVLATNLRQETSDYGLAPLKTGEWSDTALWCPGCGQQRLLGQLSPETGAFLLRCPCCFDKLPVNMAHWHDRGMFRGTSSYRVALSRLSAWGHQYYQQGLAAGTARCTACGQIALARVARKEDVPAPYQTMLCIVVRCAACGKTALAGATGLIFCHPQVQKFWRAHPRIQTLSERSLEHQGRPAYLTSFASLRDTARLDVLWDRETWAILTIAGDTNA